MLVNNFNCSANSSRPTANYNKNNVQIRREYDMLLPYGDRIELIDRRIGNV